MYLILGAAPNQMMGGGMAPGPNQGTVGVANVGGVGGVSVNSGGVVVSQQPQQPISAANSKYYILKILSKKRAGKYNLILLEWQPRVLKPPFPNYK